MANNELNVRIAANADGVKEATDLAKEQLEQAAQSASLLSKAIGVEIPEALQKAMAASELLGPALTAVFEPLAVIAFAQTVVDVTEKISQFVADTFVFTSEEKRAAAALSDTNKQLLAMADATKRVDRERRLLAASTGAERNALREQFDLEDIGGDPEKLHSELTTLTQEFTRVNQDFMIYNHTVVAGKQNVQDYIDAANRLSAYFKTDDETVWATNMEDLSNKILHYSAAIRLATATHAKFQAERSKDLSQQGEATFRAGLDRELAALKQNHLVSMEEELHFWQSKIALARAYPQTLQEINQRVGELSQQVFRKQSAEYMAGWMKDIQQQVDASKAGSKERVDIYDRAIDEMSATDATGTKAWQELLVKRGVAFREYTDKQAADAKKASDKQREVDTLALKAKIDDSKEAEQAYEQSLAEALVQGRINKQMEIATIAMAKRDEVALEVKYLRDIETLWAQQPAKVAEIERQISKVVAQGAVAQAKTAKDAAAATAASYKQVWSSIGNDFKGMVDGLIQGNETIAQAFQKLYTQLVEAAANYFEQMLMKKIEDYIMSKLFAQKDAGTSIAASAGKATAGGIASVMTALPFPANIAAAPGVGAAAGAMAMGAGTAMLAAAASSAGGQWEVPGIQATILHPQEMVLPASLASRMRNVIDNGGGFASQGGGITVVVNHSVSAVDAESFQGVVRKHGNMIGNEVARVLKKKGFGG
ncbi:MAG TPA: hypothetical protein VN176_18945 [Verrucomicrobiae bacterium]|jgi:hypothetical protein|nr:hypothetical protein [Verrucomicrobiae bacterium]